MKDADCVAFLQWCLPRLGLRWSGYRKVRGEVCKRLGRRIRALGLSDAAAYRALLERDGDEWRSLDALCRVARSRFYRDVGLWSALARSLLPELVAAAEERGSLRVRAWSAGCASGEEPYSLALVWQAQICAQHPAMKLELVATDASEHLIARARRARYKQGTLKDLPGAMLARYFELENSDYRLRLDLLPAVAFRVEDMRVQTPPGHFDLILCRNLAFTYFDAQGQLAAARRLRDALRPGGLLVLGSHESLPSGVAGMHARAEMACIYCRGDPTAVVPSAGARATC